MVGAGGLGRQQQADQVDRLLVDGIEIDRLLETGEEPVQPVETRQEEKVYDLSEFGAEECASEAEPAPRGARVYDLNEFGAVEL